MSYQIQNGIKMSGAKNEQAHINKHHFFNGRQYPNRVLDTSIEALQSFTVRPDDVWVATSPKSGTHWMLEIVHLVQTKGDLAKVDRSTSRNCIEMIDQSQEFPRNHEEEIAHPVDMSPFLDIVARASSPRVVQTHLHLEALPPTLLNTAKVIYVARNPKDVLNSMWNFKGRRTPMHRFTWEGMLDEFLAGNCLYGSWPQHVESYWKARHSVLFVFYEDIKKEPLTQIRRVADHLGVHLSDDEFQKVVEYSSMSQMKKSYANGMQREPRNLPEREETALHYMNKGIIGGWRNLFTVAQNERFNAWYQDQVAHLDLPIQFE